MNYNLILPLVLELKLLHFLHKNLPLPFLLFPLAQSIDFSCLDLLNYNFFSPQSLFLFLLLNFLKFFDFLQPLDLHEFVLLLFLNFEGVPVSLLLIKLLLSDSCCFGVGHHLVHQFDIIELFPRGLDCFALDDTLVLKFLFVELVQREVLLLFLFESEHLFALCPGQSELLLFLFLRHPLFEFLFLLGRLTYGFLR